MKIKTSLLAAAAALAIAPAANVPRKPIAGLSAIGVKTLAEALDAFRRGVGES